MMSKAVDQRPSMSEIVRRLEEFENQYLRMNEPTKLGSITEKETMMTTNANTRASPLQQTFIPARFSNNRLYVTIILITTLWAIIATLALLM